MGQSKHLRIVHCFRSPVGGIFRHVRDLAGAQAAAGHAVGIVCDSSTGGELEEQMFAGIAPDLALGIRRFPMRRAILPSDAIATYRAYREIRDLQPDVLHSHGAKGGAYARIIGSLLRVSGIRVARLYCPHGGTIHYDANQLKGRAFFVLERFLERLTDRLIFVSEYERQGYREKIGPPRCPSSLVYNGLTEADFAPVETKTAAADFLYLGMMRDLKGPDIFLRAIRSVSDRLSRPVRAAFVGDGPDKAKYLKLIGELGIGDCVDVREPMPAREAFALAQTVIIPSRAESMPYVVLEAIAAGRPIIATSVGGIPEILRDESESLIAPGSVEALCDAMLSALEQPESQAMTEARRDRLRQRFSVGVMADAVESAYRQAMA